MPPMNDDLQHFFTIHGSDCPIAITIFEPANGAVCALRTGCLHAEHVGLNGGVPVEDLVGDLPRVFLERG